MKFASAGSFDETSSAELPNFASPPKLVSKKRLRKPKPETQPLQLRYWALTEPRGKFTPGRPDLAAGKSFWGQAVFF